MRYQLYIVVVGLHTMWGPRCETVTSSSDVGTSASRGRATADAAFKHNQRLTLFPEIDSLHFTTIPSL